MKPSPHILYQESGGDADKYIELMIKHGHIKVKKIKCDFCKEVSVMKQGNSFVCEGHIRFGDSQ